MTTKTAPNPHHANARSKAQKTNPTKPISGVQALQQVNERTPTAALSETESEVQRIIEAHRHAKAHLEAVTDRVMEEEFTADLRVLNNEAEHAELRAAAYFLAAIHDHPSGSSEDLALRQYLHETINDNLTIEHCWEMPREWLRIIRDHYRAGDAPNSDTTNDAGLAEIIQTHREAEALYERVEMEMDRCVRLYGIESKQAVDMEKELDRASDPMLKSLYAFHEWQSETYQQTYMKLRHLSESKDVQRHLSDFEGTAERFIQTLIPTCADPGAGKFETPRLQSRSGHKADVPADLQLHVLKLIAEESELNEDYDRRQTQAEWSKNEDDAAKFERLRINTWDRLCALRESLASFDAHSAEMALAQIEDVVLRVDLIDSAHGDAIKPEEKRAIDRLLMSARHYLERITDKSLEKSGFRSSQHSWEPTEDLSSKITTA